MSVRKAANLPSREIVIRLTSVPASSVATNWTVPSRSAT